MDKKKGFTLVELLAVIVILAIILVIAVPMINDVMKNSKFSSIESSVMLIAKTAENKYVENKLLGNTDTLNCSDIVNYSSNDYESCTIEFSGEIAYVTIIGKGKFDGIACIGGTKDNRMCENKISNEYNRVKYIESTNGQYINTEYIPDSKTNMSLDFEYLGATKTEWVTLCGVRSSSSINNFSYWIHGTSLSSGAEYASWNVAGRGFPILSKNVRYIYHNDKGLFFINNIITPSTANSLAKGITPIYIFAVATENSVDSRGVQMKVYNFKLTNNNIIVRNMVPVKRKVDNKPGMYDMVNDVFYTNSGNGADFQVGDIIY